MTKIASVSMQCIHDKQVNFDKYINFIDQAKKQNVDLIVFPELSLQGYPPSMGSIDINQSLYNHRVAELVPEGESTQALIKKAKEYNMYICWGMIERDPVRCDVLYNVAVLVGPEGFIGRHRKVHQPGTERLYFFPGNEYNVYDTSFGKVGMLVCYDKCYPETARSLVIQGAEIILCPTAWPTLEYTEDDGQYKIYNIFSFARTAENMIFWVEANIVGEEDPPLKGAGHSRILGPYPMDVRATTGWEEEDMAIAEVDIQKEIVECRQISMLMANLVKDRRPDTYGSLTEIGPYNLMNGKTLWENK